MKILLTGDDGYNSLGTRLLIHFLKDEHELMVAGTSTQQSGVGGGMTLSHGFNWEETMVDGIKALKTEGSPVDAIELTRCYFAKEFKFDLVIAGINWGWNLGNFIISSGTLASATRVIGVGLADRAVVYNWDLPPEFYLMKHSPEENLDQYLSYPGSAAKKIFNLAQQNNFWQAQILNVNFPRKPSAKVKFAYPAAKITDVYEYQYQKMGKAKKGRFVYEGGAIANKHGDQNIDNVAIANGWITITPLRADFLDQKTAELMRGKEFTI